MSGESLEIENPEGGSTGSAADAANVMQRDRDIATARANETIIQTYVRMEGIVKMALLAAAKTKPVFRR
jgi:hypothetical protein